MSEQTLSNSKYLVLDWKIVENMRTKRDELELILFDLHADPGGDCIVDITVPGAYSVSRREGQWHEIEKASKIITGEFPHFEKDS